MPYSDYPKAASEQAQKALNHREERNSGCGTDVGWARARQLANRETLSVETVKRTYSFLSRAKVYDQGDFLDADGNEICGSVMYAAWGGDPMARWSEKIVNNLPEDERNMDGEAIKRHIEDIMEDDNSITIVFRKPAMETEEETEQRAEPGELQVGDYVSWQSSGGRSQGRITQIEDDGVVVADSGFEVTGTESNPAALISVYELNEDEGVFVERDPALVVAHLFSTLEKMEASEFRSAAKVTGDRSGRAR